MDEQTRGLGLDEILMGARRRALLAGIIFVIGSALALFVAYILPPVYSSTAKILVESQQIPSDLARSTVTGGVEQRLQLLQQRLMTRENLLEVARELNLFADRPEMTPTDKVKAMRASTSINPITTGSRRSRIVTAFTITYRANNPRDAVAVANEYVTRLLEQNLADRSARATETNAFFKGEIDRLADEIEQTEREIAEFKLKNKDRLPDAQDFRQEELLALQERRFQREKRRIELEEQKRLLSETLEEGLPVALRQLTPEEREIEELERRLAQRRAILAESHPEIRALTKRIAALEGLVRPASAEGGEDGESRTERELKRQLELIDNQLELLARQDEADAARQTGLEEAIEASPSVGLALAGLARRYEDLQQQRKSAVQRQVEAEIGERLEVNQQAERFEVIEQAQRPGEPDAPNRKLIAAGGVMGSLGLGLGLGLLLEMTAKAIQGPFQFERLTGLRPIVTVPLIRTAAEQRRRRRRLTAGALAALVGVPLLLGLIDRQVMPLPVLADRMMSKTGLDVLVRAVDRRFGG